MTVINLDDSSWYGHFKAVTCNLACLVYAFDDAYNEKISFFETAYGFHEILCGVVLYMVKVTMCGSSREKKNG